MKKNLRETMKNISVGDIKSKDDEDEVHVIDPPSSSSVPQDADKDRRCRQKMLGSPPRGIPRW